MAFRQIAWGLVEITPSNIKPLRKAAREELREHGFGIVATSMCNYRLFKKANRQSRTRHKPKVFVTHGTFEHCCRKASELIDTPKGNGQ